MQKAALSTIEIDSLSQVVVDTISTELGSTFGMIGLITTDGKGVKISALSKTQHEKLKASPEMAQIPFTEQVIPLTESTNLLVKSMVEQKSFSTTSFYEVVQGAFQHEGSSKIQQILEIKDVFVYPLITKERILGVICYCNQKQKHLSATESSILEEFANEVARVIEVSALYQNLMNETKVISGERNKLEVALSGISDAVIAIDFNRKITIFNSSAEELTGFKKEEVLNQPIGDIIKFFDSAKELTPLDYCPLDSQIGGVVVNKQNIKIVGKDGKTVSINLLSGQIKEGPTVNLGCILTLHDISKEDALEAMKLDFVSMAAHELRTPLTSIRGYLSVFMEENSKNLNTEQNMLLGRINIAGEQLMALIENLLSVSKIERGVFGIQLAPIDWPTNVASVIEDFKNRAEEKKQQLEYIPPTMPIPTIEVDKLRINEVLSNLLANAIAYTPERGQIKVSVEFQDNQVVTHIQDTGVGIPEEALPHLFTKFFRISGKLEQGSKGTGLGLYISKSVVDMHKGKIWVESTFGKGSRFSFSLPVKEPHKL